ncbi:aminotransferase class IV family protein [Streptomyces sp. NPDC050560]|uniref:aminotransferase class IV family protein n=1 Tax=Streptomyces sp. NPDC050560 TaxID=3365630 RepID=UPI0037AF5A73
MPLLDGRPVDPAALQTLALTNYGHFTTMRVTDRRVPGLDRHLERLGRDCRTVFGAELDPERVRAQVRQAVGGRDGALVVRVTVLDPGFDLGRPAAARDPHILVTDRPAATGPLPPLRVRTARYLRETPEVKHTGLFGPLHQRRAAQLAGFDDALFVDGAGFVSEGPTWNIGFVDADGRVLWPDAPVLPGVTMALLREEHEHSVIPVGLGVLPGMRTAFATNTAIGVREISGIDAVAYENGTGALRQLRETYAALPGDPL